MGLIIRAINIIKWNDKETGVNRNVIIFVDKDQNEIRITKFWFTKM